MAILEALPGTGMSVLREDPAAPAPRKNKTKITVRVDSTREFWLEGPKPGVGIRVEKGATRLSIPRFLADAWRSACLRGEIPITLTLEETGEVIKPVVPDPRTPEQRAWQEREKKLRRARELKAEREREEKQRKAERDYEADLVGQQLAAKAESEEAREKNERLLEEADRILAEEAERVGALQKAAAHKIAVADVEFLPAEGR
jgi:hypothetical protein